MNNDIKLLENNGWTVECESPFEIRTEEGSFARGEAASIVLSNLKNKNHFNEEDMINCFNAGINRGITITCIVTRKNIKEEFPTYDEYMKRYEED